MNGSFIECANLFAAGNTRPSMEGNRPDGKVCNAKPGECRAIGPHYSGNMQDNQSWTLPVAGDHCYSRCCSLVHPEGNKVETGNIAQQA